jgi:hypothetical protein
MRFPDGDAGMKAAEMRERRATAARLLEQADDLGKAIAVLHERFGGLATTIAVLAEKRDVLNRRAAEMLKGLP